MTLPEKISLRLGDLRPAVEAHLAETAETPSEYVRRLIADDLGVAPPKMPEGNPLTPERARQAAARRWRKSRVTREGGG